MLRLILVALLLAVSADRAGAHALRVFASVEGDRVSGYAFFIGGGRPQGARWSADSAGVTVATGTTDQAGAFGFSMPEPPSAGLAITVDAGDGHVAIARLEQDRFAAADAVAAVAGSTGQDLPQAPADAARLEAAVDRAVARQVAPLLGRIEQMDSRMRITDALSGLFLIFGLAGMLLWARGRRR